LDKKDTFLLLNSKNKLKMTVSVSASPNRKTVWLKSMRAMMILGPLILFLPHIREDTSKTSKIANQYFGPSFIFLIIPSPQPAVVCSFGVTRDKSPFHVVRRIALPRRLCAASRCIFQRVMDTGSISAEEQTTSTDNIRNGMQSLMCIHIIKSTID
jgi:hypothetical protein